MSSFIVYSLFQATRRARLLKAIGSNICYYKLCSQKKKKRRKKNSPKTTGQRGRKTIIHAGRKSHTCLSHIREKKNADLQYTAFISSSVGKYFLKDGKQSYQFSPLPFIMSNLSLYVSNWDFWKLLFSTIDSQLMEMYFQTERLFFNGCLSSSNGYIFFSGE